MQFFSKVVLAIVQGRFCQIVSRGVLKLLNRFYRLSFEFRMKAGILERPAHGYCLWGAAKLAKRLGYERISVAEFGVAGGNTLCIIVEYARELEKVWDIEIEVYGFDTGEGLPELEGPADLPYWFAPNQYPMAIDKLAAKCADANLVIGNVANTVGDFFEKGNRAPLAAMFIDVDFYSSTRDIFKIFGADLKHFLPRIFMYLDDSVGTDLEMYGPFNGEIAAINDFNKSQDDIKMHLNQNLLAQADVSYRYMIYYAHLFTHPDYCKYVGGAEQEYVKSQLHLS